MRQAIEENGMSAVTGIVAGLFAAAGVVALTRFVARRARPVREAIDRTFGAAPDASARVGDAVIDFEQDPETGVFRAK